MKSLRFVFILLLLTPVLSGYTHFAGLKKLPSWWDGRVFEVRGSDMLVKSRFSERGSMSGQVLEYELALERVTDKKGIVWGRQFVQVSNFKRRSNAFVTELEDGFVKVSYNGTVDWLAASEQQDRLILEEKKLYEVDLAANVITDLETREVRDLSLELKKIQRIKTFVIRVGERSFALEDYKDKLRFINTRQGKRNSMILVPGRPFINMTAESFDVEASEKEQARADLLRAGGKYREAIAAYSAAIGHNKWNTASWTGRGYSHHHLGNYQQARAHYTFKAKFGKEDATDLLYKGHTAFLEKDYREAVTHYKASLELVDDNAEANYNTALSLRALNDKDVEQCRYFKRASALNSTEYASMAKSYCFFDEDDVNSQIAPFFEKETKNKEKIISDALAYVNFHEKLAVLEGKSFNYDKNRLNLLLASHYLVEEIKLSRSIRLYEEVLASNKIDKETRPRLWYEMALVYEKDKKPNKAAEYFRKVVNAQNDGWEQFERMTLFHLVFLYKDDLKKYDQALNYVNKLIGVTIRYNTYIDYFKYGDEYRAVNVYKEDRSRETAEWADLSANAAYKQYVYSDAADKSDRASVWPVRLRAQLYLMTERYKEAIKDARTAVNLDPQYLASCYNYIGVSSFQIGNYDDAAQFLELARQNGLKDNLGTGYFEYMMGYSNLKIGNLNKGCKYLGQGVAKDNERATKVSIENCYETKSWNWNMPSGTGSFKPDIYVQKGEIVVISATGTMRFGTFAGSGGPKGISGFTAYNKVSGARHGALLFRVGSSGSWTIVGQSKSMVAEKSGYLQLLINDNDPGNNVGEFKGVISIMKPRFK